MPLDCTNSNYLPRTRPGRWLVASGARVPDEVRGRLLKDFMVPFHAGVVGVLGDGVLQIIAAIRHPDWPFLSLLGAEVVILALRGGFDLARAHPAWAQRVPFDLYFLLGHLWIGAVGIGAALMFATGDPILQILAPFGMMGIASGLILRDNGAPRFLVVQILLCTLPLMAAVAVVGEPWLYVFFVYVPMFDAYVITKAFDLHRLHVGAVLAERESECRAMRDVLTGLSNRAGLMEALRRNLRRRGEAGFSLLYLDLDGFKAVNDTCGHATGDLLLQAVATRIGAMTGETGVAARLGGDEFVVLIPECDGRSATGFGEALVAAVSRPYAVGAGTVQVGVSIGVACATADLEPDALLARADAALYAAKAAGKGRCTLAEEAEPMRRVA